MFTFFYRCPFDLCLYLYPCLFPFLYLYHDDLCLYLYCGSHRAVLHGNHRSALVCDHYTCTESQLISKSFNIFSLKICLNFKSLKYFTFRHAIDLDRLDCTWLDLVHRSRVAFSAEYLVEAVESVAAHVDHLQNCGELGCVRDRLYPIGFFPL